MTQQEQKKPVLRNLKFSDSTCLLNGKEDFPIPVGHDIKAVELYSLVEGYCREYGIDYVSEEHVRRIVDIALKELHDGVGTEEKKPANADALMELAAEHIELSFKDQNGLAHALVRIGDHREVVPIETSRFRRYLAKLFWDEHKKTIGSEAIANATTILQARAEYESETCPLSLRVASYLNAFYYDLTDDGWRSVKITRTGWEIESDTPIIFTRYRPLPQVEPDRNYGDVTLDDCLTLTNVKDPLHQLLVKVYIVSLFVPDIGHPILSVFGEKGSAKSMLFSLIKMLVDPAKPSLLTLHNDRNEFIQQLAHNWLAYYDNSRHLPYWLSDEACRATTGGGHSKRKLYSDDEDIVYDFKRCLAFNGIDIILTSEDALDRSIMIDLVRITRQGRKLEADIIATFEEIRPKLLGYIFDTLTRAIAIHEDLKLPDLPRMADFALWGEAIARAMGYKELEFANAYFDNIGKQNLEVIDAQPFGQAIVKWVQSGAEDRQEWECSPQEFLDMLEPIAIENKFVSTRTVREDKDTTRTVIDDKKWPKTPNYVSRRLNQIRSNLLEGLGIEVTISRKTTGDDKGRSVLKVRKVSSLPSLPSPTANGSVITSYTGEDSEDGEDTSGTKGEQARQ